MVKRLLADAVPWTSSLVRGEVVPIPTYPVEAIVIRGVLFVPLVINSLSVPAEPEALNPNLPSSETERRNNSASLAEAEARIEPATSSLVSGVVSPIPTLPEESMRILSVNVIPSEVEIVPKDIKAVSA